MASRQTAALPADLSIRRNPDDFDRDTSDKYSLVLNAGHEIERVVDAEGNSRC